MIEKDLQVKMRLLQQYIQFIHKIIHKIAVSL